MDIDEPRRHPAVPQEGLSEESCYVQILEGALPGAGSRGRQRA